ncbi:hypothetical protein EDD11_001936 [Mortierella claussenii]|nr:hypothetical protein EDD11_001936 [Mortierella claussenii]
MCGFVELVAWDGLIVVGVILIIIWILALTNVIHIQTSGLEHIFIALAVVFIIAWIFTRFCYGRHYGNRRRTTVV